MKRPECKCFKKDAEKAENAVLLCANETSNVFGDISNGLNLCGEVHEYAVITTIIFLLMGLATTQARGDAGAAAVLFRDMMPELVEKIVAREAQLERQAQRDDGRAMS